MLRFLLPVCLLASLSLAAQLDMDHWIALAPRSIGPAGMSGRVTSIDVHPTNKDLIYVGTASGGAWRSDNGGTSWRPIFDDQQQLSIGAIQVSDKNPSIVWAGTGEGNPRNSANYGGGIYRSLDGGENWQFMGLEATRHIHRIIVHPDDPNTVFVGAMGSMWGPNPERGVYRTTDGGKHWERILYLDEGTGIADMVMDPTNPNKIIAATWTFDRDPWFFNSGGPGSGLWITHDGGDNWERRTAKDGLPTGDLGRIGIAIAAGKPNIIYALVEAKENGLYKSTDGGQKWKLVSKKNIGNRPFYYAELYVDPRNENRIYNVFTYLSKSEDGGKSFRQIADYGNAVHPDHHAFYIDPDDPEFVIDGNDGGLNISRDGGETWRFAANLPLAQFYHINYDMSYPYLIGGGMQDNGSWVGPSRGLKSGGITDADWQEVYFGDGFDLIFQPGNSNVVYAASQGGYLGRVNRTTGKSQLIRPVHPDNEFLRFNWNAPIAQHPSEPNTLYMGSQYVHKSTDKGSSWTIISPDLTTNDSSKQRQDISGGLTIDATQAENHTTLLAIVPAKPEWRQPQALWVGSDDGKLHLSRDDGENWTDLTGRLPGMTPGSWIGYIEASPINEGEAFVVVNDYRRNDTRPLVFHTENWGESFTRLVDETKVTGHAQAIVQDPVQENLLFLGTDHGLWFSLDYGGSWTHFDAEFPHVSTIDLKIHPREHDLIIGTFGRAAWILDDIRPFRELARRGITALADTLVTFPVADAYQYEYRSYQGTRFYAQGQFQGEDRDNGALLTYWIKPDEKGTTDTTGAGTQVQNLLRYSSAPAAIKEDIPGRENARGGKRERPAMSASDVSPSPGERGSGGEVLLPPKDKVKFQIVDLQSGDTIRTFTTKPRWGMNRTAWNFRRDGVAFPSRRERKDDADPPGGGQVAPGTYRAVITYGNHTQEQTFTVHPDPRDDYHNGLYGQREALQARLESSVTDVTTAFNRLQEARKSIKRVQAVLKNADEAVRDSLNQDAKVLMDSIASLEDDLMEPEGLKGIQRNPTNLQAYLYRAGGYIREVEGTPTQMAEFSLRHFEEGASNFVRFVNAFLAGDMAAFREKVRAAELSLFGELGKVE